MPIGNSSLIFQSQLIDEMSDVNIEQDQEAFGFLHLVAWVLIDFTDGISSIHISNQQDMCTHKHEKTPEPLMRNRCIFLACWSSAPIPSEHEVFWYGTFWKLIWTGWYPMRWFGKWLSKSLTTFAVRLFNIVGDSNPWHDMWMSGFHSLAAGFSGRQILSDDRIYYPNNPMTSHTIRCGFYGSSADCWWFFRISLILAVFFLRII